jgi:pimeloyl-ACP methyl ester carboxylesterase
MVHGLGAGLAMFALNFGVLSRSGPVYALDLPGFARSSRPHFSSDPLVAEQQYVDCLEAWRSNMGLSKIHLLGGARFTRREVLG